MIHRGPFQPLPFCDSVILCESRMASIQLTIIQVLKTRRRITKLTTDVIRHSQY